MENVKVVYKKTVPYLEPVFGMNKVDLFSTSTNINTILDTKTIRRNSIEVTVPDWWSCGVLQGGFDIETPKPLTGSSCADCGTRVTPPAEFDELNPDLSGTNLNPVLPAAIREAQTVKTAREMFLPVKTNLPLTDDGCSERDLTSHASDLIASGLSCIAARGLMESAPTINGDGNISIPMVSTAVTSGPETAADILGTAHSYDKDYFNFKSIIVPWRLFGWLAANRHIIEKDGKFYDHNGFMIITDPAIDGLVAPGAAAYDPFNPGTNPIDITAHTAAAAAGSAWVYKLGPVYAGYGPPLITGDKFNQDSNESIIMVESQAIAGFDFSKVHAFELDLTSLT